MSTLELKNTENQNRVTPVVSYDERIQRGRAHFVNPKPGNHNRVMSVHGHNALSEKAC